MGRRESSILCPNAPDVWCEFIPCPKLIWLYSDEHLGLSQLPNVDPATGVRDNAVPYKVIMQFRRGLDPARSSAPCVGCNGILTGEGVVKVGDWVHVRQMGFV
jgi:hypothetical protein